MLLVAFRTDIKNRIHGALERYNIQIGVTDLFGIEGRQKLEQRMGELLIETHESVKLQLITHDFLELQVEQIERRLQTIARTALRIGPTVGRVFSRSAPGTAPITMDGGYMLLLKSNLIH